MGDKPDPPRLKKDLQVLTGTAAKEGLNAAFPGLGSVVGEAWNIIAERSREAFLRRNEERIEAFHRRILLHEDGSLDQAVLAATLEDGDFNALLAACVADVEAEKVDLYATLTRTMMGGGVRKEMRRHFILSMRDLSVSELARLRSAYVASRHELIADRGPRIYPSEFLKSQQQNTLVGIEIGNLVTRGFVSGSALTPIGEEFVQAYSTPERLTPEAEGRKAWSGHHVAIVCYEMEAQMRWIQRLQIELERERVKSTAIALLRENHREALLFYHTGILLVGEKSLLKYERELRHFAEKAPMIAVVLHGEPSAPVTTLPIAGTVHAAGRDTSVVINEAMSALAQAVLKRAREVAAPPVASQRPR